MKVLLINPPDKKDVIKFRNASSPHEKSREDILRTIDLAVQLDPDFAVFKILRVMLS